MYVVLSHANFAAGGGGGGGPGGPGGDGGAVHVASQAALLEYVPTNEMLHLPLWSSHLYLRPGDGGDGGVGPGDSVQDPDKGVFCHSAPPDVRLRQQCALTGSLLEYLSTPNDPQVHVYAGARTHTVAGERPRTEMVSIPGKRKRVVPAQRERRSRSGTRRAPPGCLSRFRAHPTNRPIDLRTAGYSALRGKGGGVGSRAFFFFVLRTQHCSCTASVP